MSTQPAPPPSPALFFDTLNGYQRAAALKTAIELHLFTAIAEGRNSAASLAAHCNIAERGARILADYLTVIGFLTKSDNRYALTESSALFLNEKSPAYAGGAIEFLYSPKLLNNFADLTTRVRRGGAPDEDHTITDTDHEVWSRFARGMAGLMALPAQLMAKEILAGSAAPMKILDVAAGHGLFGIAFLLQNPNATVTALDWPHVLNVAKENAAKANVLTRHQTLPGNALDVDFGNNFDLILLTNILHHFDPPTCLRLLQKAHAALKPAGRLATLEFAPNDDRVSPPTPAMFPLVMLANTPAGDAYTQKQLTAMLAQAGFTKTTTHEIMMQQLLVSTR